MIQRWFKVHERGSTVRVEVLGGVTTAALFAISLFFIPLLEPLQNLRFAYGPALIAVGVLMLGSVTKIDFGDLTESVPAFVTIMMMLFTYNIANGLTAGLVVYPIIGGGGSFP